MITKKILLIFFSLFFTTLAYSASMNMIGEEGDPNKIDRVVNIKMYDNYYEPNIVKIKKGETISWMFKKATEIKNIRYFHCLNLKEK